MNSKRCEVCGKTEGVMLCSRCHSVVYCSQKCQRQHWPEHRTKCSARQRFTSEPTDAIPTPLDTEDVERLMRSEWHSKDSAYWASAPATVDGMLGGLSELVDASDIEDSRSLIAGLQAGTLCSPSQRPPTGSRRALDCGAGIGRVTKSVLAPAFSVVDLVEQERNFAEKSAEFLAPIKGKIGSVFCSSLQSFDPARDVPNQYDVIWIQWVSLYLSDSELAAFLGRCRSALSTESGGSVIVVKDNVTKEGKGDRFVVDVQDGSITRSDSHMRSVFSKAGLTVVHARAQPGIPKDLFPVISYVLM